MTHVRPCLLNLLLNALPVCLLYNQFAEDVLAVCGNPRKGLLLQLLSCSSFLAERRCRNGKRPL